MTSRILEVGVSKVSSYLKRKRCEKVVGGRDLLMTQCLAVCESGGAVRYGSGGLCGWKVQGYATVDRLWVLGDHGVEFGYEFRLCFGVDHVESSAHDGLSSHALVASSDSAAKEGGLNHLVPWYHADVLSEDGSLIQKELDRFASLAFWTGVNCVDSKNGL